MNRLWPIVTFLLVLSLAKAQDLGNLNTGCDVSADALTSKKPGQEIPRTCIDWNGRTRCFYTYIPACASGKIPLVYDLHPLSVCPSLFIEYTGWYEKASKECFGVVWPIGLTDQADAGDICFAVPAGFAGLDPNNPTRETSSCCCVDFDDDNPFNPVESDDVDEVGFLRQIGSLVVAKVEADPSTSASIDTRRIYMSGHSNGCYLSLAMAMRNSDFVAGVACMAGLLLTSPAPDYSPTPIWEVHGARDIIAPPGGVSIPGPIFLPSLQTTFDTLVDLNGCQEVTVTREPVQGMGLLFSGEGSLSRNVASGCTNNATVEVVVLSNGGHIPYSRAEEMFPPPPLAASTTVDTTALAWDFLSIRQLQELPPEFRIEDRFDSPTQAPSVACAPVGVSCRFGSDCCSDRCVLKECRSRIRTDRAKLSGTRGGAAAEFKGFSRRNLEQQRRRRRRGI